MVTEYSSWAAAIDTIKIMKIGIIMSSFRKSEKLFEQIELICTAHDIPIEVKRNANGYELTSKHFSVHTLPATNRICGIRFDHIIMDDLIPEDIKRMTIFPMLAVRQMSTGVTILSDGE